MQTDFADGAANTILVIEAAEPVLRRCTTTL